MYPFLISTYKSVIVSKTSMSSTSGASFMKKKKLTSVFIKDAELKKNPA